MSKNILWSIKLWHFTSKSLYVRRPPTIVFLTDPYLLGWFVKLGKKSHYSGPLMIIPITVRQRFLTKSVIHTVHGGDLIDELWRRKTYCTFESILYLKTILDHNKWSKSAIFKSHEFPNKVVTILTTYICRRYDLRKKISLDELYLVMYHYFSDFNCMGKWSDKP